MVTKLKSVFLNPQSGLLFKTVIFAGFLLLSRMGGFTLLPVTLLVLVSIILYARPLFRTVKFLSSFSIFLASVVAFNLTFRDNWDFVFSLIYFSSVLFILLGVKDLILIRREVWGRLVNCLIAYPVFLIFFYYYQFLSNIWYLLVLFFIILLLSKNIIPSRLFYWLTPLVISQLAWASSFLPIGFVGAANLSLLSYVTLVLFLDEHLAGTLGRKKILLLGTVFILLLVAILGVSGWKF